MEDFRRLLAGRGDAWVERALVELRRRIEQLQDLSVEVAGERDRRKRLYRQVEDAMCPVRIVGIERPGE